MPPRGEGVETQEKLKVILEALEDIKAVDPEVVELAGKTHGRRLLRPGAFHIQHPHALRDGRRYGCDAGRSWVSVRDRRVSVTRTGCCWITGMSCCMSLGRSAAHLRSEFALADDREEQV